MNEENNNEILEKEETQITTLEDEESNDIKIADDVISFIAGKAVSEIDGVYELAKGFAGGISEALSKKKNFAKGVKVEVEGDSVKLDLNIIVEYGIRIPDVAFEIQKVVKTTVEAMTGLNVKEVNVHVQGVHTPNDEQSEEKKEITKEEEESK